MRPTSSFALPVSVAALLNALGIRYCRGAVVKQTDNLDFRRTLEDLARGQTVVRMPTPPSLAIVARWFSAVEEESPATAEHLWEGYLCPYYSQVERARFRAELRCLRAEPPVDEDAATRRVRLRERRSALVLDDSPAGAPFSLNPRVAGSAREQAVNRAHLEVIRSMWQAGYLTNEQLRQYVDVLWRDPAARRRHLRSCRRRKTMLEYLESFVYQTELARREMGDPPLSEAEWAWQVWRYLEEGERSDSWLRERLGEYVPSGSPRPLPTGGPDRVLALDPRDYLAELRAGLIRFFHLESVLERHADGGPLTDAEIRSVARVEILLLSIDADAEFLLPAETYAQPLLRAVREALGCLARCAATVLESPRVQRTVCILQHLEAFFDGYRAWREPLHVPRLGRFPSDALRCWSELMAELAAHEIVYFRRRTVTLLLIRALAVAITPNQSRLSRHLCASPSLLRQWDTERVGLGRRRRGDIDTELVIYAAKLGIRVMRLAQLLQGEAIPPLVHEPGDRLAQSGRALAACLSHDENCGPVSSTVLAIYDTSIRPVYAWFEAAFQTASANLGDPFACQRREKLREAAARVAWTAEDLADGFFRASRNVGLRWLFRGRRDDRGDDVFSRE